MTPSVTSSVSRARTLLWCVAAVSITSTIGLAQQPPQACGISGRITSGVTPLPGVSLVAVAGDKVIRATSSEADGRYALRLEVGTYELKAELTGFTTVERPVTVSGDPCVPQTLDIQLVLQPMLARPAAPARNAQRGRFEQLNVQTQQGAAAVEPVDSAREIADASTHLLLPPGFSMDVPTASVAIAGNVASIDRGMMGDRLAAIGRGELDPITGEFSPDAAAGAQGAGGRGGGPGGRMGGPGGGMGGPGGRGGFMLAGRGNRQNSYNMQANYTFGSSALDSAPFQLHPGQGGPNPGYDNQVFSLTAGGPVRLPGYNGQGRTTFIASYTGNRSGQLFDQYATVPSEAMRAGDFSALPFPVIDPSTGHPFAGNRIPASRMNSASLSLLRFIPLPDIDVTSRNFRFATTTDTASDIVNLRVTHRFTQAGRDRGAAGNGRGGGPARGGPGNQGVGVVMNAQFQYRRNDNQLNNVFPALGGTNDGSSLSVPVSFNIVRGRSLHNLNFNFARTTSSSLGKYAFVEDVAGEAGIFGVGTDPLSWGVPALSFSSLSSVHDVTPGERTDRRATLAYTFTRPWHAHTLRAGGAFRLDSTHAQTDINGPGAYTFTGLYTSGGSLAARGAGLDFADFLLGLPQQAAVQYGPGEVALTGRAMSLFVQDEWRKTSNLTLNLGVRYELLWPFTETHGHMVNLDVPADFTAAAPVLPGGIGPFTGAFPDTLLRTDTNDFAPRLGFAWRVRPGTLVRGGYGISYNAGSYPSIAEQLVAQPPFAVSNTQIGTAIDPLLLQDALLRTSSSTLTNNYGVDKNYALGLVQTWNVDVSKDILRVWNVGAGYTRTSGSSLDIVRAPNRGPDGLRIPDVQPFLWQTSEGASVLDAVTLRARRRPVRGIGAGITYTLARSRDNASNIGGGGIVVAQDDQNLGAEWGLSSFDRRHQLSSNMTVELPFGPNRRWLSNGNAWAGLLANWRVSAAFNWQSGTPYTPRVLAAAADVARGTSGTLRANYNGQPIQLNDPTIDLFFNTAAFSIPPTGTFGNASRNLIIGPGSRQLDAQFARDVRLGGTRVLTVSLNASNLLNMVNYAAIDTVVNSPTFGQVLSVRPMRSMQIGLRFRF